MVACQNEAPPPAASRLAQSLDRGCFLRTFAACEAVGRGSFGTVVKAWHREEQQWYAVKIIRADVRACDSFEDSCEVWSGPDVFERLRALRSANVVRYFRYWAELPEDLLHELERGRSLPSCTPVSRAGSAGFFAGTPCTANRSDDGFDWEASPESSARHPDDGLPRLGPGAAKDPACAKYPVVILQQMELCEGVTLSTWLKQPKAHTGLTSTNLTSIPDIFRQIVQGLCALHGAGVVHCDLKPANLLITKPDAQVKFFDFDCAQLLASGAHHHAPRAPLSPKFQERVYTAIGTPGYAPPEHCTFRSAAEQANRGCSWGDGPSLAAPGVDIFSAGVILLELLMTSVKGGPAWSTSMERAAAFGHIRLGRGKALPAEVLQDTGISGWARQLVLRMVVWDPDGRPSAQEVLDEVEVGLWAALRHNPNIGIRHRGMPQLAAVSSPWCTAHNPYVGYFCDHRYAPEACCPHAIF